MIEYLKVVVRRAVKAYLAFALCHAFLKLAFVRLISRKRAVLWKKVPGWEPDLLASRLRKNANNYHDYFSDACIKYNNADVIKLDVPVPFLICNTPRSIKWLLKDEFENITKPGREDNAAALLREFLGDSGIFTLRHGEVFSSDNEKWYKQRKVSSLIFTKSNFMTTFYDTFVEKARLVLNVLDRNEGKVVDVQELFFSFTMDSIEKFFLGVDVNTIEGGMSEFGKNFDLAHNRMMRCATKYALFVILSATLLPYPFGVIWPGVGSTQDTLGVILAQRFYGSEYREFKQAIRNLDKHVYKYIRQTRNDPNIKQRKDIIANFLNSSIGDELSDKELRDIVLNLTIAGRDTTACALSWMFYQLTQNLDVQDALLKEIDEVLEGRVPTMADLEVEKMPYLNGVMYETLRLHPPVPTDQKKVSKDIQFIDGTVIPAGVNLFFCPRGFGRNPDRFPDPMKFDPNRWIPFKQPSMYEFPVFQAGPRFCLGKDMAQFEMKLLAVMMLQKFRFTLKPGEASKIGYSLMLTSSITVDEQRTVQRLSCIPHRR